MKYVLICEDRKDSLEVRLGNRDKHLAYLGELGDRVSLAGPMLSDDRGRISRRNSGNRRR